MRLICPNCGAQYEVADDVIPMAGRDVQCSNCGHTWFERPGASEAAEAGEVLPVPQATPQPDIWVDPVPEPRVVPEPEAVPEPKVVAEPKVVPEPDPAPEPSVEPEPQADPTPAFDPVAAAAAAATPRRGLSADLAEMLREEAAREAEARAAEAPANPPELPSINSLSDDQRNEEVRRRTARLRGEESIAPPATAAARRELLPDIDKINSSLRPATEYGTMDTTAEPVIQARRRGARFGFSTVMLIVAVLVGLYVGAPKLSTLVPAAEPVLTRYVAVVNDARLWIDMKLQAFIADQSEPAPAATTEVPDTQAPATDAADSAAPAPDTAAPQTPAAPEVDPAAVPDAQAPATDETSG